MNKNVSFKDLGVINYKIAWDIQEKLFNGIVKKKMDNRKNNTYHSTENYLLFCEHTHVYTLGKSGKKENLLVNENYLIKRGAEFYKINRGGDITYHGPGQLVGYPILDLENFFTDINKYLRYLEEAVIITLKDFGLLAERSQGETGVWIDVGTESARKICAIGVKTSRWVTMHGFALNVNCDLSYFTSIIPCGIVNKKVTSAEKELGKKIDIAIVKQKLKFNILKLFQMKLN